MGWRHTLFSSASSRNQPKSVWCHAFFTVWVEMLWSAAIVHMAICSLSGGGIIPLSICSLQCNAPTCAISSSLIHDFHWFLSSSLSGLATLTSTGWHRLVHLPRICCTLTPNSFICYDWSHNVSPVRILKQKRNNMQGCIKNIRLQYLLTVAWLLHPKWFRQWSDVLMSILLAIFQFSFKMNERWRTFW